MEAHVLTEAEMAQYRRDGFFLVRSLFDAEEMALLQQACQIDKAIRENALDDRDGEGGSIRLALWNEAGEDLYGLFSRSRRVVDSMEKVLGGEAYHFHSKIIQKDPFVGGAWRWHQDYGYWYSDYCLFPLLASCMIAIDPATRENGCLQVLKGSHLMGRITHGVSGDQEGADPERVEEAMKTMELVHCEMKSGDALYFDCNLLHRSDQNRSPNPRWAFICCYNAARNNPYQQSRCAMYSKLEKVSDNAIKEAGLQLSERSFYKRDPERGY